MRLLSRKSGRAARYNKSERGAPALLIGFVSFAEFAPVSRAVIRGLSGIPLKLGSFRQVSAAAELCSKRLIHSGADYRSDHAIALTQDVQLAGGVC